MANEYTGGGEYQPGPARKKPKKKPAAKPAAKSGYKGVDYKLKPKPSGSRQEDMGRNPYKAPGGKRQEDMARKPDGRRQEDMGRGAVPKPGRAPSGPRRSGPPSRRTSPSSMASKRPEDMNRRKSGPRQEDQGRRPSSMASNPQGTSASRRNLLSLGAIGAVKKYQDERNKKSRVRDMGRAAGSMGSFGRRQEDMTRRKPGPRQEDQGRGLFPSLPRRPKPQATGQFRSDLRNMNPGKKYPIVKPRGNPNKQYMIKPAKY